MIDFVGTVRVPKMSSTLVRPASVLQAREPSRTDCSTSRGRLPLSK